jgi:hypothetical protein
LGEFPLASEFHATALRVDHSGAGAFADNAALKFGHEVICHMARPVGVSVSMASVSDLNFKRRAF